MGVFFSAFTGLRDLESLVPELLHYVSSLHVISTVQTLDRVVSLQTGMQHLELCPGQKFKVCFSKTLKYVLSCIHLSLLASQHLHPTALSTQITHRFVKALPSFSLHSSSAKKPLCRFLLLICPISSAASQSSPRSVL